MVRPMSQRIVERAWRAYLATDGVAAERPDSLSGVETVDGLTYAVLRNRRGVVAVYRLTSRNKLRRMKRWPIVLTNPVGRASPRERVQIEAGAAS
jgi:hypothetical protein